jgi:anti-sigma B factor antagonist
MQSEPLKIEEISGPEGGQRILRLDGPILISNLFQFQTLVRSDTSRNLVLDMSAVPYMDSAGVGALMGAYLTHQKNGRTLALVGVTPRVQALMEVTHVKSLFRFYDTLESAQSAS